MICAAHCKQCAAAADGHISWLAMGLWGRACAGEARWAVRIGCRGSVGQSELCVVVLLKAVWWDLHLASLLMHLLVFLLLLLHLGCSSACLVVKSAHWQQMLESHRYSDVPVFLV